MKEQDNFFPGCTFTRYTILEKLGEGGMGAVYLARQQNPDRKIALKIMDPVLMENKSQWKRFLQEAEMSGRLDHPNIVKIYNAGLESGFPYLVMSYIEGKTLDLYCKENNVSMGEKLRIIATIAKTLAYLHKQKIVHRDIKPSNIMITKDGIPVLMDFGIAKTIGKKGLTQSEEFLGTPHYVSPEQASCSSRSDHQSDVYSLGAVLYEMITEQRIHTGETTFAILHSIASDTPKMPSQFVPDISKELEAIILKSIEKDKKKRYPHAQAMAQDIERYLEGQRSQAGSWYWKTKLRWKMQIYKRVLCKACAVFMILCLACYAVVFYRSQDSNVSLTTHDIEKLLENYNLEKIIEHLRKNPVEDNYWMNIDLSLKKGLHSEALHLCEEAIKKFGTRKFQEKRAELLFLLHRYGDAYRAYEDLQNRFPEQSRNIIFAQCAFILGEYGKATEVFPEEKISDSLESQARYFFCRGASHFMYFLRSISYTEFLGKIESGEWKACQYSSNIQKAIEDMEKAKKILSAASSPDLEYPIQIYLDYMNIVQTGKVDIEKNILENRAESAIYSTELIKEEMLGVFAYTQKNYEKALQHFERCIAWSPGAISYPYFCIQSIYMLNQKYPDTPWQKKQYNWEKILDYSMLCFELLPLSLSFLDILTADILENQTPDNLMYSMPFLFSYLGQAQEKIHFTLWEEDFQKMGREYLLHYEFQDPKAINLGKILDRTIHTTSPYALEMLKSILCQHYQEKEKILQEMEKCKQRRQKNSSVGQIKKNILEIQEALEKKEEAETQKDLKKQMTHFIVGMQSQAIAKIMQKDFSLLLSMLKKEKDTLFLYWIVQTLKEMRTQKAYLLLQKELENEDFRIKMLSKIALYGSSFDVKMEWNEEFLRNLRDSDEKLITLLFHHLGKEIPQSTCAEFMMQGQTEKIKISAAKALLFHPDADDTQKEKALNIFLDIMKSNDKESIQYCQWHFWDYVNIKYARFEKNPEFWNTPMNLLEYKDIEIQRVAALSMSKFLQQNPSQSIKEILKSRLLGQLKKEREESVRFAILIALVQLGERDEIIKQFFNAKENLKNRMLPALQLIRNFLSARSHKQIKIENPFWDFNPFEKKDNNPHLQCFYLVLTGKIFFPYLNILKTMPFDGNREKFIRRPLRKGFASEFDCVRRTAACIASETQDMDNSVRAILQEQYYKEPNQSVKKAIVSSLVTFLDQDNEESPNRSTKKNLHEWIQNLQEQDPLSAAHGQYYFFTRRYRYDLDTRYIQGKSRWERDHYYVKHLEAIAGNICYEYFRGGDSKTKFIKQDLQKEIYPYTYKLFEYYQQQQYKKNLTQEEFRKMLIAQKLIQGNNILTFCTQIDKENPRYPFELSYFMEYLGETHIARIAIEEAITREKNRKMYRLWKAFLCLKEGNTDQSLEIVENLIKEQCRSAYLFEIKGKIHCARKEWEKALDAFTEQYILQTEHPDPLLFIAQAKLLQGERDFAKIQNDYLAKAFILLEKEKAWFDSKMDTDTRGQFLLEGNKNKLSGCYHFTLGVWEMAQKNADKALEHIMKADEYFRQGLLNYPQSPVSKSNLSQFPGYEKIHFHPFIQKLPERIQGISTIE